MLVKISVFSRDPRVSLRLRPVRPASSAPSYYIRSDVSHIPCVSYGFIRSGSALAQSGSARPDRRVCSKSASLDSTSDQFDSTPDSIRFSTRFNPAQHLAKSREAPIRGKSSSPFSCQPMFSDDKNSFQISMSEPSLLQSSQFHYVFIFLFHSLQTRMVLFQSM